jgi:predicted transcriptional regulator
MFVQDSIPKGISDSPWAVVVSMLPPLDEIPKKRKALGLTQSKLAELAGVSQSIIAKIESGTVDPSYSIAKRLVEALEKQSIQISRPRVSEIMSKPVVSVSKTQLVRDAVDLMRKRGYSQLPVLDGNRCVGSISEKTILDRAARGEPLDALLNDRVRDIMDSPLPMVNDDTPLEMVLGLLQGNYGVLVTKGESTIGILTKSDILKVKQ